MSALHDLEGPMGDLGIMYRALWSLRDAMEGMHGRPTQHILTFLAKNLEDIHRDLYKHYEAALKEKRTTTTGEREDATEEAYRH